MLGRVNSTMMYCENFGKYHNVPLIKEMLDKILPGKKTNTLIDYTVFSVWKIVQSSLRACQQYDLKCRGAGTRYQQYIL
jgi:hypothetical protein